MAIAKIGAPGAIPTRDLPLRRRTLYPTELRDPEKANFDCRFWLLR